jgi:nucleotide-binding universal stress UspA family protein
MKKILVPTDFSACAQSAAETAVELAKKVKAEIVYLHLSAEPVLASHVPGVHSTLPSDELVQAKNELSRLVFDTERQCINATPVLVLDKGTEKIEHYIEPYGIDFVVMGSHGVTGFREFILGSNTQRLVRHVHVPVLVIKEKPASFEFKNILFASAFQQDATAAFSVVVKLAKAFGATVHIVFINFVDNLVPFEEANGLMKKITEEFPDLMCTYNVAETNDEEWAIHEFGEQLNADILSLTTYDKSAFIKFISHAVAERLANHERKPVLVLNLQPSAI